MHGLNIKVMLNVYGDEATPRAHVFDVKDLWALEKTYTMTQNRHKVANGDFTKAFFTVETSYGC